mgnify:FL=1
MLTDFIKHIIGEKADVVATGESAAIAVMACGNDENVIGKICMVNPLSLTELAKCPNKRTKTLKFLIEIPIIGTLLYNIIHSREAIDEKFVDKYLYEYKVCGLRLHTLRRLEKICVGLLIVTGLVGAGLSYQVYGMGDAVLRMGACGAGLGILVWLFHLTTDENYCMQMAKNYMVDYLENVCLHKYEKANQKERTGRRDSVIKKDETNDTKEEKAEKEDKTEQEEKEESVPVSGSGVVQMQRESRRKERVKENARNLAKASARLAGTDGSKRTEDILQEEVQSTGTLAGNAQAMEIKGNADKESAQEDVQEEIPKEDTIRELPKDEMIRQILREFMA